MQSGHIGKANDLYLFQSIVVPKVSCIYMCQHDLLCQCGPVIRITKTKRKLILGFKGTHDKNSHHLSIMQAGSSTPGVGVFKLYMSDNSDSDDCAKFEAFNFTLSKILYSPVLQELLRKGNAECLYQRNLNGISDSDSNSDSNTSLVPQQISVRRDRCLKRIKASAAGVAYSGAAHDSPSSKDVTKVENATECYEESPGLPSLSPTTKKSYRNELEADMAEMSNMSESEIHAVMEEQARKKQEDQCKFLEYSSNTQGDMEWHCRC
jgi:hypothetical protein